MRSVSVLCEGKARQPSTGACYSHYHGVFLRPGAARAFLCMTADNRLCLQQPGGRIADEKLGVRSRRRRFLNKS
jgi:hypothetical protein